MSPKKTRVIAILFILTFTFFSEIFAGGRKYRNRQEMYFRASNKAIYFRDSLPTIFSALPTQSSTQAESLTTTHLEEILGLLRAALSNKYPNRESEYSLAVAGGGVRINGPDKIQTTARQYMGTLLSSRRMELILSVEHLKLSRKAAMRLDTLPDAIIDGKTLKWINSEKKQRKSSSIRSLGSLTSIGAKKMIAVNARQLITSYVHHSSVLPTIEYSKVMKGGWFSADVRPAGPVHWNIDLKLIFSWNTKINKPTVDIHFPVAGQAVKAKAELRLPSWHSLAIETKLQVIGGQSILLALVGKQKPATRSKMPFEALILRLEDPMYTTKSGPLAITFDGSGILPAQVLEAMRKIAKKEYKNLKLKAWTGGSVLLLNDDSLRGLCLEAIEAIMPANDPQRLRVLAGKSNFIKKSNILNSKKMNKAIKNLWLSNKEFAIASVATASGANAAQLKLITGSFQFAKIGLGQKYFTQGISMKAGCSGVGKRRTLAVTAELQDPYLLSLAGVIGESVNFLRMLEQGFGMEVPSPLPGNKFLLIQSGEMVEQEGYFSGARYWGNPAFQ